MVQYEAKLGNVDVFFNLKNKMLVESKKRRENSYIPGLTSPFVDIHPSKTLLGRFNHQRLMGKERNRKRPEVDPPTTNYGIMFVGQGGLLDT